MRNKILQSGLTNLQKVILLYVLENERDLYIEETLLNKDTPELNIPYGCKISYEALKASINHNGSFGVFKQEISRLRSLDALNTFKYSGGIMVLRVNQVKFLKGEL